MLTLTHLEELRSSWPEEAQAIERMRALESMIIRALETAAQGCLRLGENLAFAIASGEDEGNYLRHPEEVRLLAPGACRKRQLDWTLGRAAARLALMRLGFEDPPPVLRGGGGQPIWPAGISGSITHCERWGIAVTAKCADSLAIGIDLESLERIREVDILHLICREPELEWVSSDSDFQGRLGMVFSAKEALYKSLYPFCRRYIDFTEVELSWSPEQSRFRAKLLTASDASCLPLRPYEISCRRHKHLIFSCSVCEIK
jgi:4'-phosphopantetheinyl transferase EntD